MPVDRAATNGWSGGQYSLFRALFGTYLTVHFVHLIPWGRELFSSRGVLPAATSPLLHLFPNVLAVYEAPWFVLLLLVSGAVAGAFFAVGCKDRIAALIAWYVLACLFGRNPLIANPALPFVGWMLLAHAFLPAAPYGSFAARGRVDPGSDWRMPHSIFLAAWAVMAVGYSYSGYAKLVSPSWVDGTALAQVLQNPLARATPLREFALSLPPILLKLATWGGLALELLYAPLALFRRVRPSIWLLMVGLHLSLLVAVDVADLTLGMLLLHAFTFDPAWVKPVALPGKDTVFYDGHCGLCHRFVRFVLAEDATGRAFAFAPLEGNAFPERAGLPDSVVVKTVDGRLLARSAAIRHVMKRLGGVWRVFSMVAGVIPASVLDFCYDRIAAIRKKIFRAPSDSCPILPPHLRARFRV